MDVKNLYKELQEIEIPFDVQPAQVNYCLKCKNIKCKNMEHDDFWIDGTEFEIVMKVLEYLMKRE